MARGPKTLVRLLVVVVALVAAIYAAEALVYLLDPFGAPTQAANGRLYQEALVQLDLTSPRLFRHRQSASVAMRGHLFRTDSRGLRGPEREVHHSSIRVYSYRELTYLLESVGFTDFQAFAGRTRTPFDVGSSRLSLVATKG